LIYYNEEVEKAMEHKEQDVKKDQNDNKEDEIFRTEEIKIEEMAIDGICGVY
jgi:mycofactocin precursor